MSFKSIFELFRQKVTQDRVKTMLIDFTVSNYKSIQDQQTFSLVAEDDTQPGATFSPTPESNFQLLKSAILFGPNASGKTNVLNAIKCLFNVVCKSTNNQIGDYIINQESTFWLNEKSKNSPIEFEIEFIARDKIRYYYATTFSFEKIISEELKSYPLGRERLIFKRHNTSDFTFGSTFKGPKKALAESVIDNTLFLSKGANNNVEQLISPYLFFKESAQFFIEKRPITTKSTTTEKIVKGSEAFKNKVLNFLKAADTGIFDIRIDKEDFDLPSETDEQLSINSYFKVFNKIFNHPASSFYFGNSSYSVKTIHKNNETGSKIAFPLDFESRGTQALYNMAGSLIDALEKGKILIVDEIEQSLHPEISAILFSLFNSKKTNPNGAQLIATTHDTTLLSAKIFQRDQIWFTQKSTTGCTKLYSLLEFKKSSVRKEAPWSDWYLDGRFHALPYIDDTLLENIAEAEESDA